MFHQLQRVAYLGALLLAPVVLPSAMAGEDKGAATSEEATAAKKEEIFSPENVSKLSETYGHFVYKSLTNPTLRLDFAGVLKGMQEAKEGKPSPMTEQQYEEAICAVQEVVFKEMASKNLAEAETFLAKNVQEAGVVELDKGKVQILVTAKGEGEAVAEGTVPVLHYTGKYLNGTTFGSSRESGEPVSINLKHTIPGFRQGVLGMKPGEKRTIFIHPEVGYGTSGQLLPNALLIFEVELVRIDPEPKKSTETAESTDSDSNSESDDQSSDDVDLDDEGIDDEEDSADDADEQTDKSA